MNKADRVLMFVLGISLLANVFQFWSVHHNARVALANADAQLLPPVGAKLSELHLVKIGGGTPDLQLGSNELPIVVYVLSPNCKWCKMNWPKINYLATQLGGKYRFVGISGSSAGLEKYVIDQRPAFPVYYVDANASSQHINVSVTPQTLVFSSEGLFLRGWGGFYAGDTKTQISSYFGVKIPD